jgi:hypothetical protein
MAPLAPVSRQRSAHEPLYDVNPQTGASIEVFYSDRTLETFGRGGAGWFWWSRERGLAPAGLAVGPFPTSYSAYRSAILDGGLGTNLGTNGRDTENNVAKSDIYVSFVAERVGFEPTVQFPAHTLSKRAP